jgi:hypothetical protein
MANATLTLDKVLSDRYGVGILAAPVYAVVWAAEYLAEQTNVADAKAQLSKLNSRRVNRGVMPAYVPFGHNLF